MLTIAITFSSDKKAIEYSKHRHGNLNRLNFIFHLGVYGEELPVESLGPTLMGLAEEFRMGWIEFMTHGVLIDFNSLKKAVGSSPELELLAGMDAFAPKFNIEKSMVMGTPEMALWNYDVTFSYPPIELEHDLPSAWDFPQEFKKSMERFRKDYPNPNYVAFIMMQFGGKQAYSDMVDATKKAFAEHGIIALRADEKTYHDDLYYNILTYIHGAGIGIAIFDRIQSDNFNPNVSLEVGYMFALGKPVCLLKDDTLPRLPTDIVGRLYVPFDTRDVQRSITAGVAKWVADKGYSKLTKPT